MAKNKKTPEETNKIISFETFQTFGSHEICNMTRDIPTCFNGMVKIKKYKVTIEPIEESIDAYTKRLQDMWEKCDNHHHVAPIESVAKSLGIILKGNRGSKLKK